MVSILHQSLVVIIALRDQQADSDQELYQLAELGRRGVRRRVTIFTVTPK